MQRLFKTVKNSWAFDNEPSRRFGLHELRVVFDLQTLMNLGVSEVKILFVTTSRKQLHDRYKPHILFEINTISGLN